jgi:hypothetical protein
LKNIKAPIIPPSKPTVPDKSVKNSIVDENAWLYYAFEEVIEDMERAIEPLDAYVQTFAAFQAQNDLNPDKYVSTLDEVKEGEDPISPEGLEADVNRMKKLE